MTQVEPAANAVRVIPVNEAGTYSPDGAAGTARYAEIDRATSGELVAAVVGKRIRVLSYVLVAAGAVTVEFRSAATGISGAMSLAANGGISAAYSPLGHFQTAVAEALNLQLGSGVQVSGHLVYVEV